MKLWDDIKKWAKPYSDEDEDEYYDDEYDEEPADDAAGAYQDEEPEAPAPSSSRRASRRSTESVSAYDAAAPAQSRSGNSRVVNINATTQLQVVLVRPENFDSVSDLAQHLRERHALLLNLEKTDKNVARRLVDFLSGCAFALDGKIKKVAASAYLITPYNVDIVGDLVDNLENNGMYF